MKELDWYGCYNDSWQGEIVPEAFSHPAKFARGLIGRIYEHCLEQGYLKPGDTIGDPFGGVALGAVHAMLNGLQWAGVELEPKFVDLGNQNLEFWAKRYGALLRGTAVLIQGDSRNFAQLVKGATARISSPPFVESIGNDSRVGNAANYTGHRTEKYAPTKGNLGNMKEGNLSGIISSPPFGEGETRNRSAHQGGEIASMMTRAYTQDKQGETPGNLAHLPAKTADLDGVISSAPFVGTHSVVPVEANSRQVTSERVQKKIDYNQQNPQNLGNMKEGDLDSVISSPPYVDAVDGKGEGPGARFDHKYHNEANAEKKSSLNEYGREPGNLGNMPGGDLDGVISPPPFENNNVNIGAVGDTAAKRQQIHDSAKRDQSYGATNGQLGNDSGDSFWQAASVIVAQVVQSLKPGGTAVWVCGDFVRKGERIYFGKQWERLCNAQGLETVEWITAWKTEHKGTQLDIFGNAHEKRVDRVSFFRRLQNEKNPDAAVLNEDVIIMRKVG